MTGSGGKGAGDTEGDPWVWIAFLLPALAVLLSLMQTEDLAYQVRAGSLMWSSHSVLRTDPFTFTVGGSPWQDQQWGAQLVFAALHAMGGWGALVITRATIVGAVVGVTYVRTRARSRWSLDAVFLTFAPFLACLALPGTLAMRPQLVAVPLFVVASVVLERRHAHPNGVWWLPAVGLVWANVHGSFVLLPVLCGIALVADLVDANPRVGRLVLVTTLVLIAGGITPWWFASYTYVYDLVREPIVRDLIDEWKPIWQQGLAGILFAFATIGVIAALARGWKRARVEDLLTIGVFTVLAVISGRNLVWWTLAVPPALAPCLGVRARPDSHWSRASVRVIAIAATVVVLGGVLRVISTPPDHLLADAPQGITEAVDRSVGSGQRVFSGWWWGWLEFAVPPARQFVDARAEIFPAELWADYFEISTAGPGWRELLDRWDVGVVVASRAHQAPLIDALGRDPGWRTVYVDGSGTVFVRSTTG
jgi:hypothetical protein